MTRRRATRPGCACGARCSATSTSTGRRRRPAIDADFQRWLTETAWGGLWTRDDQLDRRTRSCVTIAVLTALRAERRAGRCTSAPGAATA